MKTINAYITEKLKLTNQSKLQYQYFPKDVNDLRKIIEQLLNERGPNADLNDIDVSHIKDMFYDDEKSDVRGLFRNLDIHNIDISDWDVSECYNMCSLFVNCKHFNCDLSKWKVNKVENMGRMFAGCESFTGEGLDKWHVDSCDYMMGMFSRCTSLNAKKLENWNVENVTDMGSMFKRCPDLDCNFSYWKPIRCKKMYNMFYRCINFKGTGLDEWDVKSVEDKFECMFEDCRKLDVDLSGWENDKEVKYDEMFYKCDNMSKEKLPSFVIVDF